MRGRLAVLISAVVCLLLILLILRYRPTSKPTERQPSPQSPAGVVLSGGTGTSVANASTPTVVYAHNLMLRKGPDFRIYIRWLRGEMVRAHRNVNPSFDDPESFFLDIKTGVLRANVGDLNHYLNSGALAGSPLTNIALSGDGDQVKLKATLHKGIPLPVEVDGTISVASENRIQMHVTKLNLLKIPFKGLLGGFHVTVADLFHAQDIPGIQVSGNDIWFDTQQLLPPPHIRGQLTKARLVYPDLEEIYGNAESDVARVEQWRNFLSLRDGTIDFGKLTMRNVDLIMIDISQDAWFDLDLNNYQTQLVNGYTRMTPQAGLQIFMPDLDELPKNKASQNISIEWLKNRNVPPPADVTSSK